MPVTHKEGDRYPLGPPDLFRSSTAVVQLAVNQLVVGSIPTFGASFRILAASKKLFIGKKKRYPVDFISVWRNQVASVIWGHVV
jgi:hypothetical protein